MSKEQAKGFFYEVAKNKELAESVSQLMKESLGKEAAAERLISLAKDHGFNFTKEEAAIAQRDFKIPLSDDDLEEVSGGFFGAVIAVFTFALSAFAGAGYLANLGQPDLSAQYQMKHDQRDVDDEDLDEFSPAMFDAQDDGNVNEGNNSDETLQSEDNDDVVAEENNFDESSNLLFNPIQNGKMYESQSKGFASKDDFNSDFDQEGYENGLALRLNQIEEVRMTKEMRDINPPLVALSSAGSSGGSGGDDEYKNKFRKAMDDFLSLQEKMSAFKNARELSADIFVKLKERLPSEFSNLTGGMSKLDLNSNDETSGEQMEEQQNNEMISRYIPENN